MAAKKTTKKKAAKKTTKKKTSPRKAAPTSFGDTSKSSPKDGGGFAMAGFGTDHVPATVPIIQLRDKGECFGRFIPFPGPGGQKTLSVSIRSHRVNLQKRWRWFTEPEHYDPLGDAGHKASWQWVSLFLLRKSSDEFHNRITGQVGLVYLGRKAVDYMNEMLFPKLNKAGKRMEDVDIHWKRIGQGVNSQHFFDPVPRSKPLTKEERAALRELPNVMDIIKPLPQERLDAIANKLTGFGGGDGDEPNLESSGSSDSGDDGFSFD